MQAAVRRIRMQIEMTLKRRRMNPFRLERRLTCFLALLGLARWHPLARVELPVIDIDQDHVDVHVVRRFRFQSEDFEFQRGKHPTTG